MVTENKILEKYSSKGALKYLQKQLLTNKFIFNNKISIAKKNIYSLIEDILNNEDNFIECDICNKKYTRVSITKDFDGDLSVCDNCKDNYYNYCSDCCLPIYIEGISGRDYHILDDELYCNDCYFKEKEVIIENYKLTDKKLKAINRYLRIKKLEVNFENLKDIDFKIHSKDYGIEPYGQGNFRLGSWSANCWVDLTSNESNLLKAIQYIIDLEGYKIQEVKIS